jgi:hypothetical protein
MACFKEMNSECPPFLTLFVPLVNYEALVSGGFGIGPD